MIKNEVIHCSFEPVDSFYLRIPEQRCPGEDETIPRICAAKTVEGALNAIPQAGEVIRRMQELDVQIVIHVYYLSCNDILDTDEVSKYVPDANRTGEVWLLKEPDAVRHEVLMLSEATIFDVEDCYGTPMCTVEGIEYTVMDNKYCNDNWRNLLNRIRGELDENTKVIEGGLSELKSLNISYRTFMSNLRDEDVQEIFKMIEGCRIVKDMFDRGECKDGIL